MSKRSILFIGDSQCASLKASSYPFYENLPKALAAKLKADVHIYFDCQPWRRIASCYYTEYPPFGSGNCHSGADHMDVWCARQTDTPFTDIIVMMGVNNFKKVLWSSGVFPPDINNAAESVQKDIQNFINKALSCNNNTTVTVAGSLNVQNCGGGHYLIDTCRDEYGTFVSQYFRSDWYE